MGKLKNLTVLITGGTGILGNRMAYALGKEGATVIISGLNAKKIATSVSYLREHAIDARGVEMNVLDESSIENALNIIKEFSIRSIDILINAAGGNHPKGTTDKTRFKIGDDKTENLKTFFELDKEGIQFVFDLNFMGTLLPIQKFAPLLMNSPNPSIVNISSMNAFKPLTKIPAYSAAKAAVSNFTQWLATHFADVGIRVNAIDPGFFLTKQNNSLLVNDDNSLTERGKKIINHTPLGRFGEPEDLDTTITWLCDPSTSFVTGIIVPVDGGFSAFSGI